MKSMDASKYRPYPAVDIPGRTWPDKVISKAPVWVSVDLRDGNQALPSPMNVENKLKMFKMLVDIGFKEIEVAFPSASQVDFDFVRTLIEGGHIPDDVTIQVLTQAREHLIRRTFESLKGVKNAIVHMYNSTSTAQRKIVFNSDKAGITRIAVDAAALMVELRKGMAGSNIRFEYSPESFTGTEIEYAMEIVEAVKAVWKPTVEDKMIVNLPSTVEMSTPNVFADRVEWFIRNITGKESVILSAHPHNDRGTAVATGELAVMAGAERVEGSLFGNGERTGNMDIITMALNMFSRGVGPELDFSNIDKVVEIYKETTGMEVHPRQPYAGELVYTAFSGSHQDAINKGMRFMEQKRGREEEGKLVSWLEGKGEREEEGKLVSWLDGKGERGEEGRSNDNKLSDFSTSSLFWEVPYLPIDPKDVGRSYEGVIRINSQSGKGGAAFILEKEWGFRIPKAMQPSVGSAVQKMTEEKGRELTSEEVRGCFGRGFLAVKGKYELKEYSESTGNESSVVKAVINDESSDISIEAEGNGPVAAFVHGLNRHFSTPVEIVMYEEHALSAGADAEAAAYIGLKQGDVKAFGAGVDANISRASVKAVMNALNNL